MNMEYNSATTRSSYTNNTFDRRKVNASHTTTRDTNTTYSRDTTTRAVGTTTYAQMGKRKSSSNVSEIQCFIPKRMRLSPSEACADILTENPSSASLSHAITETDATNTNIRYPPSTKSPELSATKHPASRKRLFSDSSSDRSPKHRKIHSSEPMINLEVLNLETYAFGSISWLSAIDPLEVPVDLNEDADFLEVSLDEEWKSYSDSDMFTKSDELLAIIERLSLDTDQDASIFPPVTCKPEACTYRVQSVYLDNDEKMHSYTDILERIESIILESGVPSLEHEISALINTVVDVTVNKRLEVEDIIPMIEAVELLCQDNYGPYNL